MTKVVFFFAGTGDDGAYYAFDKEDSIQFKDDVIRVYIKGCQEEQVGNGFLSPDLDIAANNVRSAFESNTLDLAKLKERFGDGLYTIMGNTDSDNVTVDEVILEGFSRGAVTTFATAKKLDDLNIPIHILANQPVPGESSISKSLFSKYHDLSHCKNIETAHTFIASYNLENGFIQNKFFKQMVAKFSSDVQHKTILVPHQQHLEWFRNSPISRHINKVMSDRGLTKIEYNSDQISSWYQYQVHKFTPSQFMQEVYGVETSSLTKDPIYLQEQISEAKNILESSSLAVENSAKVDSENAAAIISIKRLKLDEKEAAKIYQFILEKSERSKQFIKIVTQVTEVCEYLPFIIEKEDEFSEKSSLIESESKKYKTELFKNSFNYLSKEKPSLEEKKQFAESIYQSELQFRQQALGIDRNSLRAIMKVLTNFITHVTLIGLIFNIINKVQTGNWLFFAHNRSENAIRDIRKNSLVEIDKLDEPQKPSTEEAHTNSSSAPAAG